MEMWSIMKPHIVPCNSQLFGAGALAKESPTTFWGWGETGVGLGVTGVIGARPGMKTRDTVEGLQLLSTERAFA
jgi:hypothetical protein